MNDDELDEMLRELATPQKPEELASPRRFPVAELVAFAFIAVAILAWAFGALAQIFG